MCWWNSDAECFAKKILSFKKLMVISYKIGYALLHILFMNCSGQ